MPASSSTAAPESHQERETIALASHMIADCNLIEPDRR
jgi:hypothetical protein